MLPRSLAGVALLLEAGILVGPHAAAQCAKTFGPMALDQRAPQNLAGDQFSCRLIHTTTGFTIVWSSAGDISMRRYSSNLVPLGDEAVVNTTSNAEVQYEPAIAQDPSGSTLVVWTDRHGYDGSGSGIMGRVFDAGGTPLAAEFVVNFKTASNQSGPEVAALPSGGFVVTWTGDADDNVYLRILNANGAFVTRDVAVNTYTTGSQKEACAAVNTTGTVLVVFVDHSSHGNVGTGANLWGRRFDSAGTPLDAQEYPLTASPADGDQLHPRIAADGLGRFVVVWQDELGDGSGDGIFERVFDHNGAPLAAAKQVNTGALGDQVWPSIALDSLGRQMIAWTDYSAGAPVPVLRARHLNAQSNPFANDFQVNENPGNGTINSSVAMDGSDIDTVFAYEGPGASGNGKDVYLRRFDWTSGPQVYCAAKVNSQGCSPSIGWSGDASVTSSAAFSITGTNVLNQKVGLLFYGYNSTFTPFQGSTICVTPPLKRLQAQNSGGNVGPTDCSGVLSVDFNARIRGGIDPGLVSGATISARWYYRDGHDPAGFGSGLSDALRFVICP